MVNFKRNFPNFMLGVVLYLGGVLLLLIIVFAISLISNRPKTITGENTISATPEASNDTLTISGDQPGDTPSSLLIQGTPAPIIIEASSTPPPTLTPTITLTSTPTPNQIVEEILRQMTLDQKIGQMLLMGIDGTWITSGSCGQVQAISPGGIIYRGTNVENPQQLTTLSSELQKCSERGVGIPLLIAIDHEGQYVTRFNSGITVFPAAMAQGAAGDPALTHQAALAAGQELAYSGVNMVLGPVADVLTDYDNTVISQRSFGGRSDLVSQHVREAVLGYLEAGILPVLKHYPGHGGVAGDTHNITVQDPASQEEMVQVYLPPFRAGVEAGAPAVMFGHVIYPSLDETGLPASLSPNLIDSLRNDIGFDGITMTDSMGMGAITASTESIEEAAVQAIRAGEDMLLVTSPMTAQMARVGLLNAVNSGQITQERIDQAVRVILATKQAHGLISYPLSTPDTPYWQGNTNLGYSIGYQSIYEHRDQADLIPIPPDKKRVLIIGPTDGWGLYDTVGNALQKNGISYEVETFSGPWSDAIKDKDLLNSLPFKAAAYDLTIVFTWDSHLNRFRFNDTWQSDLVNRLLTEKVPLIVIALKSPTDIIDFPLVSTYLATFGTTPGQLQGVADVLTGVTEAGGSNPLPELP